MFDHVWTVLCSNSVVDQDTKVISLHEVVEQINGFGPAPPRDDDKNILIPFTGEVVSLWVRSSKSGPCKGTGLMKVKSPENKYILFNEFDIDLTRHVRLRSRMKLPGLPYRGPGQYFIETYYKKDGSGEWEKVSSVPLDLVFFDEQLKSHSSK